MELVRITEEATDLQRAYLDAGIVTPRSATDALHVAIATAARCPCIVSWNFRHIVHFDKVVRYNEVNARIGFAEIRIVSPPEIIAYEDEDV